MIAGGTIKLYFDFYNFAELIVRYEYVIWLVLLFWCWMYACVMVTITVKKDLP